MSRMRPKSFSSQWASAIVALWVFRLITAAVSFYAGAGLSAMFIGEAVESMYIGWVVAVIFLSALEVFNASMLFGGFRLVFAGSTATGVTVMCIALLTFLGSAFISVNGAEQSQSTDLNRTDSINALEIKEIEAAQLQFDRQLALLNQAAADIRNNPIGIKHSGHRYLKKSQQKELGRIRQEILTLRKEHNKIVSNIQNRTKVSLKENLEARTKVGNQYYYAVAVIMLIQILSSCGLAFLYTRIANEKPQETKKEEVAPVKPANVIGFHGTEKQVKIAAGFYQKNRPELFRDVCAMVRGQLTLTNRELSEKHGCSVSTVKTVKREAKSHLNL